MPPLSNNDIVQIKLGSYCQGQAGINISYWRVAEREGTGATPKEVANKFDQVLAPLMKAVLATNATYYGVSAQKVYPDPVGVAEVEADFVGPGNPINGLALPTQVSSIFTLRTAKAGRQNRGRQFIPFPGATANDTTFDRPTDAHKGFLQTLALFWGNGQQVGTAPNLITMYPIIFNKAAPRIEDVTGVVARQKWATQRRRGNYGQPNPYPPF